MRKPDKYNYRDTVTVKGIVYQDRVNIDGTVQCSFNAPNYADGKHGITFCVPVDDIATHTPLPRPLQVGDIVRDIGIVSGDTYTILAIHKDFAWVKPEKNDRCFTWRLDRMERV